MSNETVRDVDQAIIDANAEVERLEQAVVNGDRRITAEKIEDAKRRIGFLGLRRQAAEKRSIKDQETERQAAIQSLVADREKFYSEGIDHARRAYSALIEAGGAFVDELKAIRETVAELKSRENSIPGAPGDPFAAWWQPDDERFLRWALEEYRGELLDQSTSSTYYLVHALHDEAARKRITEKEAERDRLLAEQEEARLKAAGFYDRVEETGPDSQIGRIYL